MRRRALLLVALLIAAAGMPAAAPAKDLNVNLPPDAKFVVRLDLAAIRESEIGGPLFEQFKAEATKKIGRGGDGQASLDQISQVLGFNPFEEVQSIMVAASDYESPEFSLVAAIQLRRTTGNLEGLVLALPEYATETHGDYQIHYARPEEDKQVFAAVHTADDGNRTVVLAAQREALVQMLESFNGKASGETPLKAASFSGDGEALLAVKVFELPPDMMKQEGPPANIAKIVSNASLQVAEADDQVKVSLQVEARDEKQAEQLKQMAQGLIAMVNLKASSDPEDEKARQVQRLLQDVRVNRSSTTVEAILNLPAEEIAKLIEAEIKRKHNR